MTRQHTLFSSHISLRANTNTNTNTTNTTNMGKYLLFLCLSLFLLGVEMDPRTPTWGGAPSYTVRVKMTDPADSPDLPEWYFNYSYFVEPTDPYHKIYSRYNHEQGNGDEVCKNIPHAPPPGTPCVALHSSNDNWLYIEFYSSNTFTNRTFCCKCTQHIGAVKWDWLFGSSTYEGEYNGDDSYGAPFLPPPQGSNSADRWFIEGQFGNNYYATTDKYQLPVRYNEKKSGVLKQWDFDLTTYEYQDKWLTDGPPPGLFSAPDNCENMCHGAFCTFG